MGLAAAVDYALEIGLAAIEARITYLADQLRLRLASIPGVTIHDLGERKCGIVTFDKASETPTKLAERLQANRINISVSTRESAPLDFGRRMIVDIARASVHYFNIEDEIERFSSIVGCA